MTRQERVAGWTRAAVRGLKPYYKAPLEGSPLRLDQNTNLWGRNPVLDSVPVPDVDQYPTRDADALMAALAQWHGLTPDHFAAGNGSDELLDIITKAFASPGQTMAVTQPSYSLYPFYADLQSLKLARIPLKGRFALDVEAIARVKPDLVILATPNNPTGNRLATSDIESVLAATDGVVVVDEAYIEYAGLRHSFLPRVEEFDNLIVLRTMSKAYGLAGLRIGYMAANLELMARLRVVKPPFNVSAYSEAVAVAALQEQSWVDEVVAATIAGRDELAAALKGRGFRVHASDANFILAEHATSPSVIADGLRKRGVLIRTFPGAHGIENAVRFGVGRPEHTKRLLAALDEVLA